MRIMTRDAMVGAAGALASLTSIGAGSLALRSGGIALSDGTTQTTA